MNVKTGIVFLLLALPSVSSKGQPYPKNYFSYPLDSPLVLLGTFGEIRKNHFHSGIDISTNQQEGKPVYAASDGYVSRIKITNGGFGKAIYVTHPNGYVTVYGHLKKFNKSIQSYVLKAQHEKKSYEIELTPLKSELPVKKHEVIAFTGNTGDAEGPHLHFEIRDEKTEEPINPLLFDLLVNDTIAPSITNFRIFPFPGRGLFINTDTAFTFITIKSSSGYTVQPNIPIRVFGSIGFGLEAIDKEPSSDAILGIYSVTLKIDQTVVYQYKMDRINFNDMRYVNAHIDYRSKLLDNLSIQRCFRLPGNHLKLYSTVANNGYFDFINSSTHDLEITVTDFNGNISVLSSKIISDATLSNSLIPTLPLTKDWISEQKGLVIENSDLKIVIPKGAVYDTYPFESSIAMNNLSAFSPVCHVGDRFVPVHTFITIGINQGQLPESLKQKAAIVSINKEGKFDYEGGTWDGKFLSANVKYFGDFTVVVDTVTPVIMKMHTEQSLKNNERLEFKITDELSGVKSYQAMVDGHWLLMEYTKNGSLLTGDISVLSKGKHRIVLSVSDRKNNNAVVDDFFYR